MSGPLARLAAMLLALALVAGCMDRSLRPSRPGGAAAASTRGAVAAVREAGGRLSADPDNAALKTEYLSLVERAIEGTLDEARGYLDAGDTRSAEAVIAQALAVLPDSAVLKGEMERVQAARSAQSLYRDAVGAARQGYYDRAREKVERALTLDPSHEPSIELLAEMDARRTEAQVVPIRLSSSAPVTISFNDVAFKEAMLSLGSAYGVNMIFDPEVEDRPVSLYVEQVTFQQAFRLLLRANRSFYRRMGTNSVVIAPDTAEGRARYEDYVVRTFYVENAAAQEMGDLIARSIGVETVSVNPEARTVTIRDTRERVAMAEQLVNANDRAPAEVVMEVEILEVNRSKSEQLGLDFGSQIALATPTVDVREFNSLDDIADAVNTSALSLPAVTLRYFKQDVDAQTLANPSIRTVDGDEALIHIGDRVPLRSSTIQDATGQTRTTFDYRDVGIKLTATPQIRLDRSVAIDLTLEVSSLGQNLGTADEPAFAIGTRNIATRMVLDDGETAIIGGLIRDEERASVQRVPGLGNISRVGQLFRSRDRSATRTDIVLTLSPRIVRGRDIAGLPDAQFFSGNGQRVSADPNVDFVASQAGTMPVIRLDMSGRTDLRAGLRMPAASAPAPAAAAPASGAAARPALPAPGTAPAAAPAGRPGLSFGDRSFEMVRGAEARIPVMGENLPEEGGRVRIRFRPDLVEVTAVEGAEGNVDNRAGTVDLLFTGGGAGEREVGLLTFSARKPGLSYLILSAGQGAAAGDVSYVQSRIVIR